MKKDTKLTEAGRDPASNHGIINPPVYHASTVTFPTVADLERIGKEPFKHVYYGRYGTPTAFAFEDAICQLEGANHCVTVPSGMASISVTLTALLKAGDHVLMVDNVYAPTRKFCDVFLKRYGVQTTYYDPMIGSGITELIKPETKIVFTEAPGSLTFEVQDIPAIAEAAHAAGALVVMDNTWSGGLYFQPFEKGVDISLQAATKYIVGHSDAMLGTISTKDETLYETIKWNAIGLGSCAGPDDIYLGLRGIRSLSARLARHQENALTVASWLKNRDEVATVLHPAFPECPGHEIWKRDFTGSSGLFAMVLKGGYSNEALTAMLDGMRHFPMGYSWGGFESLMIKADPQGVRSATHWPHEGRTLRLHIGQEDPDDLIADLEKGLERLNRT